MWCPVAFGQRHVTHCKILFWNMKSWRQGLTLSPECGLSNINTYDWWQGDPSIGAVCRVGLRPLACWDCGFEFRWGHGYWSFVNAVCSTGRDLCDGPIPRPNGDPPGVCLCPWVWLGATITLYTYNKVRKVRLKKKYNGRSPLRQWVQLPYDAYPYITVLVSLVQQ